MHEDKKKDIIIPEDERKWKNGDDERESYENKVLHLTCTPPYHRCVGI